MFRGIQLPRDAAEYSSMAEVQERQAESLYIAPFILRIVSKHPVVDHTVLPANYTMPAFPS